MVLGNFRETSDKFVAGFRHRCPLRGNFFQIAFFANAQGTVRTEDDAKKITAWRKRRAADGAMALANESR